MTNSKPPHACRQMLAAIKEDAVWYWPEFREYLIPIRDGGSSGLELTFCPWCGEKLPDSKRDEYFQKKEQARQRASRSNGRRSRKKAARPA